MKSPRRRQRPARGRARRGRVGSGRDHVRVPRRTPGADRGTRGIPSALGIVWPVDGIAASLDSAWLPRVRSATDSSETEICARSTNEEWERHDKLGPPMSLPFVPVDFPRWCAFSKCSSQIRQCGGQTFGSGYVPELRRLRFRDCAPSRASPHLAKNSNTNSRSRAASTATFPSASATDSAT